MIQHYSKVALRNLMKYKTQNLISTIGLAVGLLCFSICFYCSRYMPVSYTHLTLPTNREV